MVVPDSSLKSAWVSFEQAWPTHFWLPVPVQGHQAFDNDKFRNMLHEHDIKFRPVPSRERHNIAFEPKHGVIRSIFIRLQSAGPDVDPSILASRSIRISNYSYGTDMLFSFELANGCSKPLVLSAPPSWILSELLSVRVTLIAK